MDSLWIRIKGRASIDDTVVGVCYRPHDQEQEVDKAFCKQLEVALQSPALVLMGDLNHPDICWQSNTVSQTRSRWFLKCVHDDFLMRAMESLCREMCYLLLFLLMRKGW